MNSPSQQNLLDRLNSNALQLCRRSIDQAEQLGIVASQIAGASVLDFGIGRAGTLAAGIRLAEICLSGIARVELTPANCADVPFPQIMVSTDFPLAACIASQYAGWAFSVKKYFAMCSGPARLLRGNENILSEYGLSSRTPIAVGIFESNALPSEEAVQLFAESCGVTAEQVTLCLARTASFPGTMQVVARSVETTLHKLHELQFDLRSVRNATGTAPLPPIAADDLVSLGWTNDSILYGSSVNLWVETTDSAVEQVLEQLPSSSSSDFGEPFLNIFNRYDRDFYKIDKSLFSPAQVTINNLTSGRTFACGRLRSDLLRSSFGLEN